MFCPKCGVEVVTKDSNFCSKCGFDRRKIPRPKSIVKKPSPLIASGVEQPHGADGVRRTTIRKKTSTLRVISLFAGFTLIVLTLVITVALVLSPSRYVKAKVAVRSGDWAQIPNILFGPSDISEARQLARGRHFNLAIETLTRIPQSDRSWDEAQRLIRLLRIEWGKYLWDSGDHLNAVEVVAMVSFDSISITGVLQPTQDYKLFLAKIKIAKAINHSRGGNVADAFSVLREIEDPALSGEVADAKAQICSDLLDGDWRFEKTKIAGFRFSNGHLFLHDGSTFVHCGNYSVPSRSLGGVPLSFSVPPIVGTGVATFICNGTFTLRAPVAFGLAVIVYDWHTIKILGRMNDVPIDGVYYRGEKY